MIDPGTHCFHMGIEIRIDGIVPRDIAIELAREVRKAAARLCDELAVEIVSAWKETSAGRAVVEEAERIAAAYLELVRDYEAQREILREEHRKQAEEAAERRQRKSRIEAAREERNKSAREHGKRGYDPDFYVVAPVEDEQDVSSEMEEDLKDEYSARLGYHRRSYGDMQRRRHVERGK